MAGDYSEGDMLAVKEQFKDLPERDPGEHWYDNIKLVSSISKKGKKAQSNRFDEMALQHFEAYLSDGTVAEDMYKKQEKAASYVNGLLTNGGPSTDVFKKALGVEVTGKLFKEVLFGVTEQ